MLPRELTGKSGPEDKDDGEGEGHNENTAVHEDAPELDDREDSILEQDATDHMY